MAEISKITLPSGNTYEIKDATARELIAGGLSFEVVWDGTSAPEVANIPAGVVVTYNGTDYTGTMPVSSAEAGTFYLVKSGASPNAYDEYVVAGPSGGRFWERLGGKDIDLSNLGALAYKDNVTLSKGSGDNVLGEATTFTAAASAVSFAAHTTDNFVKSVSAVTGKKMVTTTVPNVTGNTNVSIPNVTNAGSASTWNFAMGTGTAAETLIISGGNSTAPTLGTALSASKVTLGTAKTVATGALSESGTGDAVVSDVQVGESAAAITALGAGTAAAQSITVGTNDKVSVAKYGDLNVSVS